MCTAHFDVSNNVATKSPKSRQLGNQKRTQCITHGSECEDTCSNGDCGESQGVFCYSQETPEGGNNNPRSPSVDSSNPNSPPVKLHQPKALKGVSKINLAECLDLRRWSLGIEVEAKWVSTHT